MALTFPNPSRSYDAAHRRIRFPGYDGPFEIPFFIEIEALSKATSLTATAEADCLAAFDRARGSIEDAARQIYALGRRAVYVLTAMDFR
jgi:hypothetical protein